MLTLAGNYPDVLVHRLHVDDIRDIYQQLLTVLFDDDLATAALLVLNISDDLFELVRIDGFGKVPQSIDLISFKRIFDVSRKEDNEDFLGLRSEVSCKSDAVYRRHLDVEENQVVRASRKSFREPVAVSKSLYITVGINKDLIQ